MQLAVFSFDRTLQSRGIGIALNENTARFHYRRPCDLQIYDVE